MKKNTAYTIGSLVILLICAFCFVILPAMTGSGQSQGQAPVFGKYDGRPITMSKDSDMQNFAASYSQMFQQYGQQLDEETSFYIMNYAFNSTASKYAYQKEVKDSGFVVSDTAINNKMVPYFLDENGEYSSKLYKQTPEDIKLNLRNTIEDELYTTRFYDDNFGSDSDIIGVASLYGIKEAGAELDFLQDYNKTKRGFTMAYFPLSNYPEEEVEKFAKANANIFTRYDLSVITVEDESTAKTVSRRLSNNEITFTDAVNEYSNNAYGDSNGKITNSYKYQIEEILANKEDFNKIDSMPTSTVSTIIQTGVGYSIFMSNGNPINPDYTNESTLSDVKNYISKYESSVMEDYFTLKANNLINEAKVSSFKTACGNHDAATIDIPPFPLNYGSVSIAPSITIAEPVLVNADKNENFLNTAFSLKKDEISKPFVMNKNIVVLQFTTEEETSAVDTIFNAGELKRYDETAAQNYVLNNEKLENNFSEVYFKYFMSN